MRCEHNKGLNLFVLFRHSSNAVKIDKGDQNFLLGHSVLGITVPSVELEKFCQGHYSAFLSLWVPISE